MKNIIGIFLIGMILISACKKEEVLPEASRLFRPVISKDGLLAPSNYIEARWQASKEAASYKVQISVDSFKTIALSFDLDTNYALFPSLKYDQLYQVQVKAIASDTLKNSKFALLGAIKTPKFPTILNSPTLNDLSDASVKLSWKSSGATVTSIKVYQPDKTTLLRTVVLTSTDVTNQYRIITGLVGNTNYYIELYSGTTIRGYDNYKTKAPFSGIIIDLREIQNRPNVLMDTLPVIPSGSTVILKRGLTYNISSAYELDKTVTFVSGNDLLTPSPATIFLAANFNLKAGSSIDSVIFRNINLKSDSYTGKYVMNISKAGSIGKIKFEGCNVAVFRGIVRLQSAVINVNTFEVNNCIIDSISNYGVINVDNVNCKVNDILFKNSTFYKTEKVITSKQNSNSVIIESCTFNEAPFGGNYLIDYGTSTSNSITLGIKFYNSILGIGYSNAGNISVNGYRANSAVLLDVSNTYSLSDYLNTLGAFPNLIPYTRPSTDVFTDPAKFNFKIKDTGYPGRSNSGDPRWRL